MEDRKQIRGWIRELRKIRGWSVDELISCAHISYDTLMKYQRGERRPSRQTAEMIADCLRVTEEARELFVRSLVLGRIVGEASQLNGVALAGSDQQHAVDGTQPASTNLHSSHEVPESPPAGRRRLTNVPQPLTSIIGRDEETNEIEDLLCADTTNAATPTRLVTLLGPGGVGKSRLAVHIARKLLEAEEFSAGVWLVELSALSEAALVDQAIATTLEVRGDGDRPILEDLKEHLRDKQMLLVLDNFENVLDAAPIVNEMLADAPQLRVIVTSRSALRIAGEQEFSLEPLQVPDLRQLPPTEALLHNASVRLFIERARAAKLKYTPSQKDVVAIAKICARVDGLPLAIELAAARIKLLSPPVMLERMKSSLDLLIGGSRDQPARHRALRNTIQWSYDALRPAEQMLFRRLAVFVGGCTLESVEAVCEARGDLELDVLDGLAALLDSSLLRQEERGDGQYWFVLLQTIREYALECLAESGELDHLRGDHLDHYVALAERADQELNSPAQKDWLQRLDREIDNLRAALGWALEAGNLESAARLCIALRRFWWHYGYISDGRRWLDAVLAQRDAISEQLRAKVLRAGGILVHEQGQYELSETLFEESLALHRQLGDKEGTADSLNDLGMVASNGEDYEKARILYKESLKIMRDLHDDQRIAVALNNLGSVEHCLGNYVEAERLYEQSLALCRAQGDTLGIVAALNNLGEVEVDVGNYLRAAQLYTESLVLCRDIGDVQDIAVCLEGLAGATGALGKGIDSARLFGAAEALRERTGVAHQPAYVPIYQQLVDAARGHTEPEQWQNDWNAGRAMSLNDATIYAAGAVERLTSAR